MSMGIGSRVWVSGITKRRLIVQKTKAFSFSSLQATSHFNSITLYPIPCTITLGQLPDKVRQRLVELAGFFLIT